MSSKKKVLVFIDWYLPGFKAGGPIQSCANLVDHLSDKIDFFIVTRDTDYCETQAYQSVRSDAWNILENGTRVYYCSTSNLSRNFIKKICQETEFDTVYLNGVYSYYFSILPLFYLRNRKAIKVIIAARGMLSQSAINVKKTKKKLFLFASKLLGLYKNCTFQASTEAEVKDIQNAIGLDSKISLAGNLPKKGILKNYPAKEKTPGILRLISIARIAPEKNLSFALELLKNVKSEIQFDFYGPIYTDSYYSSCLKIIESLPSNCRVNYCGSIESNKVAEVFQNYHALLMPTLGENFGHIILESFLAACPVIISNQTPWRNLSEKKVGFDLSLSNPNEFVNAIEKLANFNFDEYSKWSLAAKQFGENYAMNPEIVKQNLNLFQD